MSLCTNLLCAYMFCPPYLTLIDLAIRRWYNNPSSSSKGKGPAKQVNAEAGPSRQTNGVPEGDATEPDSQPLDFNTFVPSHNSSLVPVQPPPASQSIPTVPGASAPIVSRDEAFQNAMSAMYWSGYWTAAYHVCPIRALQKSSNLPLLVQSTKARPTQEEVKSERTRKTKRRRWRTRLRWMTAKT